MPKKTAVITGGAGFLGSHLAERLVDGGWHLRILDDLSAGRKGNLSAVINRVDFRRGDILDDKVLNKIMTGADVVFHLAAKISVTESFKEPESYARVNVAGLIQVLEAARKRGVRRLIFPSSASVYGDDLSLPKKETSGLFPASPYAVTKVLGEALCRVYCEDRDVETVALRFFNIYGPRQDPRSPYASVIPKFIDALSRGERPTIFGDGEQTRDFVHVDDAVKAMILAARRKDAAGEVFNIASGTGTSIVDVFESVRVAGGWSGKPRIAPARPGEVKYSRASIAKARRILGFKPAVSLDDGIRRLVRNR